MSIARDISRQSKKQIINISSNTSNIDVDGGFAGSTLDVYLNGSKLIQNADYTLNGNSGITLTQSAVSGDVIEFIIKTTSNILSIVDTSALVDESVTFGKLSNSATEADNVQKRTAKAWVNFNGTGTVSKNGDFNVSSITDVTTGQYFVNFVEPMPNTDYVVTTACCVTTASVAGTVHAGWVGATVNSLPAKSTSQVFIGTIDSYGTIAYRDAYEVNVVIFSE